MTIDPRIGVWLSILIAVELGMAEMTTQLNTIFGAELAQKVVAGCVLLGALGSAINAALHAIPAAPTISPKAFWLGSKVTVKRGVGLMILIACTALLASTTLAMAQQRQPSQVQVQSEPKAGLLKICDPLNLLPGCKLAEDQAGPDLWQKILNASIPDLTYAKALADQTGTNQGKARATCYKALLDTANKAQGNGLTDANGQPLVKPDPALFSNFEQFAEVIDNLGPASDLTIACAPAAQVVKMSVGQFLINVLGGAAGLAKFGIL